MENKFSWIDLSTFDLKKAQELGGIIELEENGEMGKVALIRDPSGAGFTCYEGSAESLQQDFSISGKWCWSELFVNDISLVNNFYSNLFNWKIDELGENRYSIRTSSGLDIGAIHVADDSTKGKKQFWAVFFAVSNMEKTLDLIKSAGGQVDKIHPHEMGSMCFAHDDQDAAFVIIQSDGQTTSTNSENQQSSSNTKFPWRSLIGLAIIYFIVFYDFKWAWGILFLFWVIPDLKNGTTYFIEPINRDSNPILYWTIMTT